ncbi:MAG: hypothetical protein DKM23_08265 [Candidatus Melainabacteria bacterium]|jgi:hypothetical protein|nr:MAG: hypothetical protein DKM23_08265 [Candidatus Melainabacteria bacterium]
MENNLETKNNQQVINSLKLVISPLKKMEAIKFNYEELKGGLQESLKKYQNLVYTSQNIKEAKDDRATLNALKKSLNDEKIKIKKEFEVPYKDFEDKIKELIELVDKPASEIDKQVKIFEEAEKVKKRESIENIYAENIGSYADLIPLQQIYDSRWENKTYKETDIKKEIQDIVKKADSDIKVIAELKSEFEFQIKDTYFRTLDLGQALVEKQRLEKQKELLTTIKQQQVEVKVDSINNIDSVDSVRYAVGIDNSNEESTSVEEKMISVAFRVECTESQLKALGEFMKANGIKYGRA